MDQRRSRSWRMCPRAQSRKSLTRYWTQGKKDLMQRSRGTPDIKNGEQELDNPPYHMECIVASILQASATATQINRALDTAPCRHDDGLDDIPVEGRCWPSCWGRVRHWIHNEGVCRNATGCKRVSCSVSSSFSGKIAWKISSTHTTSAGSGRRTCKESSSGNFRATKSLVLCSLDSFRT